MPFKTKGSAFEKNFNAIEKLFRKENFVNYKTIITTNQPYISSILYKYHYYCWFPLIQHYIATDNKNKVNFMLDFMDNNLITDSDFDISIKKWLQQLDFINNNK